MKGVTSRLVGNPTANPMSHPPANLKGNPGVHPVMIKVMVKVIVVSRIKAMKKAVRTNEYLALASFKFITSFFRLKEKYIIIILKNALC